MIVPRSASRGVAGRIGDVLLASIRSEKADDAQAALAELLPADQKRLPAAAAYHRLVGAVFLAIKSAGNVDQHVIEHLRRGYQGGIAAQLRLIAALRDVTAALDSAGLQCLTVKGPVLSHLIYSQPGRRLYFDVDVIVRQRDFRAAVEALESTAWRIADKNWDLIRREMAGQLKLVRAAPESADVHWHLLYARKSRREFSIRMDDLFEHRRLVDAGGLRLATLDPADTIIHLAMHAAHEGGDRLVWLKDIEQAVTRDHPNWDDVVHRAREWRVNLMVGTMLLRTRAVMRAPIPDSIIRDLIPGYAWRAVLSTFDRIWPTDRSTGRGTPARLAARSARATVRATLVTFVAGAGESIRTSLGRRARPGSWSLRDAWRSDPEHSQSLLRPTGTPEDRAAFLAEIADSASANARR